MIKYLIMISFIVYWEIVLAWYFIFTYQFTFKININIKGETLQKEFKNFELFLVCIFWIFIFPKAIKNMLKNDEEE